MPLGGRLCRQCHRQPDATPCPCQPPAPSLAADPEIAPESPPSSRSQGFDMLGFDMLGIDPDRRRQAVTPARSGVPGDTDNARDNCAAPGPTITPPSCPGHGATPWWPRRSSW